jgi:isochorismate hydrolase
MARRSLAQSQYRRLPARVAQMEIAMMGPQMSKSALIIVDMQNDFVHPEGDHARGAREGRQSTCSS